MTSQQMEIEQVPLEEEDNILDPIVMVPYITKVGELPRKVAIERRKRCYASQNLIELLENEGLTWQSIQLNKGNLPLHAFDNTDFETREPSKWVDKMKSVPAQVIALDSNNNCTWRNCKVLDYNRDENTYLVCWIDTGQTSWIPRVLLYFKAESPFIFAKRFAQAYRLRDQMESIMKYHFYVDSMPKEDIRTLGPEPEERIRNLTLNVKELKEKALDVCKYLNEVNTEYARVMNQIVLEDCMKNQNHCGSEFTVEIDIDCIEKLQPPVPL